MNRVSTTLLALALGLTTACGADENRPEFRDFDDEGDLVAVATAQGLTSFLEVAAALGLRDALSLEAGNGTVLTFFAPTNAAFAAFPEIASVPTLEANPEVFSRIIRYHALGGFRSSLLVEETVGGTFQTAIDEDLTVVDVSSLEGGPTVEGEPTTANITTVDLFAQNGVIHEIDAVLLPPLDLVGISAVGGLSSLVAAAKAVGLDEALTAGDPLTVFAPTDDAFTALGDVSMVSAQVVENVLLTHVVSGTSTSGAVLAADSFVTLAGTSIEVDADAGTIGSAALSSVLDVPATNGVAHVIEQVITPPTILEVAMATTETSTLVQAVGLADAAVAAALDPDTLMGDDPITVFAPTNAAFLDAGIDPATTSTAVLTAVLQHHLVIGVVNDDDDDDNMVTEGQVLAADLSDGDELATLNGTLTASVTADGAVTLIDGAGNAVDVIQTDIRTLSGVVHLIDGVLLPE